MSIPGRSTVVWVESTRSAVGNWWVYAQGSRAALGLAAGLFLLLANANKSKSTADHAPRNS